jgi:hypothetical protein
MPSGVGRAVITYLITNTLKVQCCRLVLAVEIFDYGTWTDEPLSDDGVRNKLKIAKECLLFKTELHTTAQRRSAQLQLAGRRKEEALRKETVPRVLTIGGRSASPYCLATTPSNYSTSATTTGWQVAGRPGRWQEAGRQDGWQDCCCVAIVRE